MRSIGSVRSYARAALALLAAFTFAGCSSSTDSAAVPSPSQTTSSSTSTSGSPAPTRSPGAGVTPGGGGTAGSAPIGSTPVTYPSGLAVSVTSAIQFVPSSLAVGAVVGHTGVVLSVTVDNGSSEPLDSSYLTVAMRTGSALTMSAQIFDAASGFDSGITGTVAAGDVATGQYAFDLPASDLSSLNVLITPDLRSPSSAMFTGSATAATAAPSS